MNINISNELKFLEDFEGMKRSGSLAKFTWKGLIHIARDPLRFIPFMNLRKIDFIS